MKTINLTKSQIKEISEELSIGLKCFYHFPSGEIKIIYPNEDGEFDDEDDEESEFGQIMADFDQYFEFEQMTSRESFQIMEDFIETVADKRLANSLVHALNRQKPFRHFGGVIDNSKYRLDWFKFRDEGRIAWIEKQINRHNDYASVEENDAG
jgi:hypothetical protein